MEAEICTLSLYDTVCRGDMRSDITDSVTHGRPKNIWRTYYEGCHSVRMAGGEGDRTGTRIHPGVAYSGDGI